METHLSREIRKGTTPFLVLAILEDGPAHGYEVSRLIDVRSSGAVQIHAASLYPLLYRMEEDGWITGKWVEKPGQRRRRYYALTAVGRKQLVAHRREWGEFVNAIVAITGPAHA